MDNSRTVYGMIQEIVIEETKYLKHYIGKVVDINDESNSGRVKVTVDFLGWRTPALGAWCYPRDKHSMIVPKVEEWVEVYFIAGNRNHPVFMGIANEMKDQLTKSYAANTDVLFERDDCKVTFDESLKQFLLKNVVSILLDANLGITIDGSGGTLGITLKSGDASTWLPNTMIIDPLTKVPHGGIGGGISKLRGA